MANGSARVQDYFMDERVQCSRGVGVCPDTSLSFTNDLKTVSGVQDSGITLVRYTRPLSPSDSMQLSVRDSPIDRDISIEVRKSIQLALLWPSFSVHKSSMFECFIL